MPVVVVVVVVVVVSILQKTENVKACFDVVLIDDDESKTKRRRSLKKSKFLTTQTKAKCDFPRSRGGRENKKEGLTHNFGAIYRVLYDFLFRVFSMSE